MCTRPYPECNTCSEGCGTDGECDMDSSSENINCSDSLNPKRKSRWVTCFHGDGGFNNRPVSVSILCPLFTVMLLFLSAVATLLVQHLPPSSLGRSSLRTTVKVRTWSSFPAALVLKRTTKQMDSQTWDPHFPAGQHFSVGNTAVQKKLLLFCSVFPPALWVWFKSV